MKKAFLLVVAVLMIAAMALVSSAALSDMSVDDWAAANGGFWINQVTKDDVTTTYDIKVSDAFVSADIDRATVTDDKGVEFTTMTITDVKVLANDGATAVAVAPSCLDLVINGKIVSANKDGEYVVVCNSTALESLVIEDWYPVLEQNPGVAYNYIEKSVNVDGSFDLVIDIKLAAGYMIEDNDLHDGVVPSLFVARTVYDADNSTQKTVQITPNKAGHYAFTAFGAEDDFIVDHVSPVVITLDAGLPEGREWKFEADGHTYIFKNFVNNGTITFVNGKTDYTKVLDGAYVDAYGHIIHETNKDLAQTQYKSYYPTIDITGTFTNNGLLQTVLADGRDCAETNLTLAMAAASGEVRNNGTMIFNGSAKWILAEKKSFYNFGTIKVLHAARNTSNNAATFTVVTDVVNSGYAFINDADALVETEHGTFAVSNLDNAGTINFSGNVTIAGKLLNTGVMTGTFKTYPQPVTSKPVNCNPKITANASVSDHVNKGTITITGNTKAWTDVDALWFCGTFTNEGTMTIEGMGANVIANGLLVNKKGATFTFNGINDTANTNNNTSFEVYALDTTHYTEVNYTGEYKADFVVRPLGITNDGVMNLNGGFLYVNGKTVNNGELNMSMKFGGFAKDGNIQTAKVKVIVYDNCKNCPGHEKEIEVVGKIDGRVINNGVMTVGVGRFNFTDLLNAKGAKLSVVNNGTLCVGRGSKGDFVSEIGFDKYVFNNNGEFVLTTGSKFFNFDDTTIAGTMTIEKNAVAVNYDEFVVAKGGSVVNNGTYKNYDASIKKINDDDHSAFIKYTLIKGEFINNGVLYNEVACDIRVEGTLDNVAGKITNKGMIVNVGTFTSTKEGIDNQFAIHGYDVTYVNKGAAEAPADTTAKADAETPAETTKAPVKTPAAQTSDVAVAGFAVIATLALAGVVVAKKVR
ncbi:MAG: hypothetical protein IKV54_02300 [Clostridia bacterium]|nr:hypothetical protein [Clostridia bacterium]